MTFTLFLCRQYGLPEEKRGEEGEERDRQHTALPGFQVCFTDQTATHTHTCMPTGMRTQREGDRQRHTLHMALQQMQEVRFTLWPIYPMERISTGIFSHCSMYPQGLP